MFVSTNIVRQSIVRESSPYCVLRTVAHAYFEYLLQSTDLIRRVKYTIRDIMFEHDVICFKIYLTAFQIWTDDVHQSQKIFFFFAIFITSAFYVGCLSIK